MNDAGPGHGGLGNGLDPPGGLGCREPLQSMTIAEMNWAKRPRPSISSSYSTA